MGLESVRFGPRLSLFKSPLLATGHVTLGMLLNLYESQVSHL